jgi:hypothetical protein
MRQESRDALGATFEQEVQFRDRLIVVVGFIAVLMGGGVMTMLL